MNIDTVLTKFDNMLLGLNGKPSLLSKIKDIFVIKDNPDVRTNKQSNNTNSYNYSRNINIEEICKLPCELRFYKSEEDDDEYEVCFSSSIFVVILY
jgi:2-iminoacetate synthase ThiH